MFDPLINGSFFDGYRRERFAAGHFLELEITTERRGREHHYTQNVIHRLIPGNDKESRVEFVHPLNLHKVKSTDVVLEVPAVNLVSRASCD